MKVPFKLQVGALPQAEPAVCKSTGMKSYLDLVGISAKLRKRQSRMSILCIVFSVFLVTAIFGMADMEIRSTKKQAEEDYGKWHVSLRSLEDEEVEILSTRPEVDACTRYDVLNYRLDENYRLAGEEAVIAGFDREALAIFPSVQIQEGMYPEGPGGVLVDENTKKHLNLAVGEEIILSKPDGAEVSFRVTGVTGQFPMLMEKGVSGLMMNIEDIRKLCAETGETGRDSIVYVKFTPWCNIREAIRSLQADFGLTDEQTAGNEMLLATMGQSDDPTILILYGIALMLSALVSVAGILMISSSLNSNIAQRTEFFGLLRCLGADGKQIRRFVRKEALYWCRIAIPAGLIAGTGIVWILCFILRITNPTYFGNMPGFGISGIGILGGTGIGLMTVLFASRAPARRATKVSPLEAVSGNNGSSTGTGSVRKAARIRFCRIETALGIHHALGSKKNYFLMAGSFAFTIILFLAFSTTMDFMHHAINGLQPYTPDLSLVSRDNSCSVDRELTEQIGAMEGVKRVYGRMFAYDVPVRAGETIRNAYLISYEGHQFAWAKEELIEGSLGGAINGGGVLAVFNADIPAAAGDTLTADFGNGEENVTISGILSQCPFHSDAGEQILICSEETFRRITGKEDYTIIDIQLKRNIPEETVDAIRGMAGEANRLLDRRMNNQETRGSVYSFTIFIYGFLSVIAMITIFHVVNSIAMSVSARMRQYGAMRAVGMDCGQIKQMIAAEAAAYALGGTITGCAAGIPLNRFLYEYMVTLRWGDPWYFPTASLIVILLTEAFALVLAVYGPVKRVEKMSVVETILVG